MQKVRVINRNKWTSAVFFESSVQSGSVVIVTSVFTDCIVPYWPTTAYACFLLKTTMFLLLLLKVQYCWDFLSQVFSNMFNKIAKTVANSDRMGRKVHLSSSAVLAVPPPSMPSGYR